jgi:hypothetical protein
MKKSSFPIESLLKNNRKNLSTLIVPVRSSGETKTLAASASPGRIATAVVNANLSTLIGLNVPTTPTANNVPITTLTGHSALTNAAKAAVILASANRTIPTGRNAHTNAARVAAILASGSHTTPTDHNARTNAAKVAVAVDLAVAINAAVDSKSRLAKSRLAKKRNFTLSVNPNPDYPVEKACR